MPPPRGTPARRPSAAPRTQSPGSWPSSTARTLKPTTVVARNAWSLRVDGTAMLPAFLMPIWASSPWKTLRRSGSVSAAAPHLGSAPAALSASNDALTSALKSSFCSRGGGGWGVGEWGSGGRERQAVCSAG
jgi:hypothetical protein